MRKIEIYEDPNGKITLRQYRHDSEKPEITLKGEQVLEYLQKISSSTIEDIEIRESSSRKSLRVSTGDHVIDLIDLKKLDSHEEHLRPLFRKVDKELTDKKIRELKSGRAKKTPPKTTRKNKYNNCLMKIGVGLTTLAIGVGLVATLPTEATSLDIDNNSSISVFDDSYVEPVMEEDNLVDITLDKVEQMGDVMPPSEDVPIVQESKPSYEVEFIDNNQVNSTETVEFSYEDNYNSDKAITTRAKYGYMISLYANKYGVDPDLMIAIATQEKGEHSAVMDPGGATGIMQIQNEVWLGKKIQAYNYETGKYDSFIVDNNKIQNLETNIQMGCMYFQNCLNYMNYNIPAAIQCYNMGSGNMDMILNAYANDMGTTRENVLSAQTDNNWMNYRYLTNGVGDANYVENVVQWLGTNKTVSVLNRNNNSVDLKISNNEAIKTF
ncbi:MAG: transglycosylase SLT domain-containing protein [Bacilli bacterium]|nr:transglycosylase SLT domain-containing protein [Bacilli bacterium]